MLIFKTLTNPLIFFLIIKIFFLIIKIKIVSLQIIIQKGPVAQLNRVSDYGSEGYRFESCRDHSKNPIDNKQFSWIFCFIFLI